MDRKLTVLLVEDDKNDCDNIKNYIQNFDDISLAGITDDEDIAVKLTAELIPDAIILDLELHAGKGNGLSYLRKLRDLKLSFKPYILITTNNTSVLTYECARDLGADFIMYKHQSDYSTEKVVEFLRMMRNIVLCNTSKSNGNGAIIKESPTEKSKRIERMISIELDHVGINPKAIGYTYLTEAIGFVIQGHTTHLCKIIGELHKKTDSSVERAMQNAINRAWRTADIEDLLKYYTASVRVDRGVPTIMEFVFYYSRKIQNQL